MLNDSDEERFDGNIDSQHHPSHSIIENMIPQMILSLSLQLIRSCINSHPPPLKSAYLTSFGNLILTQTTFSDGGSIDLSSLAAGVYFVQSDALQHTVKITIAK